MKSVEFPLDVADTLADTFEIATRRSGLVHTALFVEQLFEVLRQLLDLSLWPAGPLFCHPLSHFAKLLHLAAHFASLLATTKAFELFGLAIHMLGLFAKLVDFRSRQVRQHGEGHSYDGRKRETDSHDSPLVCGKLLKHNVNAQVDFNEKSP